MSVYFIFARLKNVPEPVNTCTIASLFVIGFSIGCKHVSTVCFKSVTLSYIRSSKAIEVFFNIISGCLLESLPSLLMVGGQDMPRVFCFHLLSKLRQFLFRMIVLYTKFYTGWISKNTKLMIITVSTSQITMDCHIFQLISISKTSDNCNSLKVCVLKIDLEYPK